MTNTTSSVNGRVRLGLVGTGGFGSYTADIIAQIPEIQLVGVADPNTESASLVAERYDIPSWSSHEELIAECDCDAVAVVTPHNTHRDIAVAAARAGRHVFCEKTMAINAAECHEMIDAATAAGVKLMVGHKRRFRPAWAEMKRLLESGEFGKPVAVNIAGYFGRRIDRFYKSREASGGLLYWAGVHDVDTIRHLMGEVNSVYATIGPKLHPEIDDLEESISVTLNFASGAIGSLQVSTYYPMATYRTGFSYQIVCERGGIAYDPRQVAVVSQLEGEPAQTSFFEGYDATSAFLHEWSNFAAWILRDEPPVLTGEDGLRCVEILQAAYISADRGSPVKLPLDTDDRRPYG